jgi:hypothetical protein
MVRLLVIAITVLSTSACGRDVVTRCQSDGLDLTAAFEVDCASLELNVEVAQLAFDRSGTLPSDKFSDTFRGLSVHVRAEEEWTDMLAQTDGAYDVFVGIEVNASMSSLAHELLHALDMRHGNLLTATHAGWDRGNYAVADTIYLVKHCPPQSACEK